MKLQCSCGGKYFFDITPEMRTNPVRFVCPACGLDASELVDGLIRQELGQTATPAGRVVTVPAMTEAAAPVSTRAAAAPQPAVFTQPPSLLRVQIQSAHPRQP